MVAWLARDSFRSDSPHSHFRSQHVPIIAIRSESEFECVDRLWQNFPVANFMKIRLSVLEFVDAIRRIDRQADMTKLIGPFLRTRLKEKLLSMKSFLHSALILHGKKLRRHCETI
jgi:hypothetical protein